MADRECVLRFFAFSLVPYTTYKAKEFDGFLNDSMHTINNMPDTEIIDLELRFLRAMQAAYDFFGKDAFRKRYDRNATRYPINKALFESWSVNLDRLDNNQLKTVKDKKDLLQEQFIQLMLSDDLFSSAVSQGTGDSSKVKRRFSTIEQLIKDVLR